VEIRIVKKRLEEQQPSPDDPGEEIWHGGTDSGPDSSLPASILASLFDIGKWYRFKEFIETWEPSSVVAEKGEVTEISVRILAAQANYKRRNSAKLEVIPVRVRSSSAAVNVITEILNFIGLLEVETNTLWIRID
jgi:hypothetical protein